MTITLRSVKGAPLSHEELDSNFTDLDDRVDDLEAGGLVPALASEAEAEAGTDNTKIMTPLRVSQAITELGAEGSTDDQVATEVPFTPAGGIAATDVQAALEELDAALGTTLRGVALDATVGSPSDGEILVFRSAGSDWVLEGKPVGADPELDELTDVVITEVANNDVLAFDTSSGDWTNQNASEAGLQATLSPDGVTVRSTGALSFDGGTDGQIWTVQADGSVAFETVSAHTHELVDITDAGTLAGLEEVDTLQIADGAVTADKLENQASVTPGAYTSADITVSQEGIITAVASGAVGGGGLTTVGDAGTAITIGDALDGTHRRLTGGTTITLTLDAQGTVGTRVAVTPKGAGAVVAAVEAGATYELPGDNNAARTTGFSVTGYVLFEVIANSDDDSAVWDVVGETSHTDTADNALDMDGQQITNAVMPLADDEEIADFTFGLAHSQQAMVRCNHATVAITATVPANATTAFPVGTVINLNQWGAAAVDVAAAGGVTINTPADKTLVLRAQYSVASLWKQATDTWLLFGDLTDA